MKENKSAMIIQTALDICENLKKKKINFSISIDLLSWLVAL